MNRPSSMLGSTFDNLNPQSSPSTSNQQQHQSSSLPHPTTSLQQSIPTQQHHFPHYPSSVHLPAVSTYIGHYRKYLTLSFSYTSPLSFLFIFY